LAEPLGMEEWGRNERDGGDDGAESFMLSVRSNCGRMGRMKFRQGFFKMPASEHPRVRRRDSGRKTRVGDGQEVEEG